MDTKGTTEQEGDQRSHGLGHQGESDVRVGIETGKAEPAGNKANQESELGKTEIAESNAMGHNARGTKTLGTEEVQGLERRETVKNEMEARKEGQEEMENSVAEDKSGTEEPKEEADGPGTPEEPKEGEGEAGTLGENISIPNREAETVCIFSHCSLLLFLSVIPLLLLFNHTLITIFLPLPCVFKPQSLLFIWGQTDETLLIFSSKPHHSSYWFL